jgi:histidine triad (HIT) family protein
MESCRFCDIISGKVSDYKVWEDDDFVAILDASPANEGHTLLIPKKHVENIFDLEEGLYKKLFANVRKLAAPIKAATGAKRIGLAVVGFSVAHAHLHIVPMHKPNELFKSEFPRASPEKLQTSQKKLIKELKKFN